MSKAHDMKNEVKFFFSGDRDLLPSTMEETNFLSLSKQVVTELTGRVFSEWRYAREALWKAVYKHHGDVFHLSEAQKERGRAFFATKSGKVGKRERVEIHHRINCQEDMGQYSDLANYIILYPATHDLIHLLDRV